MGQTSAEWEESLKEIGYHVVVDEWTERHGKHRNNHQPQFHQVSPLHHMDSIMEEAFFRIVVQIEAIDSEQEDKHRWSQIQVDMLEAEQHAEPEAAPQVLFKSGSIKHKHQEAIHHSIVLEMDMINNEKSWRENKT